jgi:NADH:ubiquinone oxidoreductase subunit K
MAQLKKLTVAILIATYFLGPAFAYSGVAVKSGDWIEYKVTVTGNPPADLDVTWARIDVTSVEGSAITVDVKTMFANGTIFPEPDIRLNVATGAIGDGFFIPTELQLGDVYSTQYEGNITITGPKIIDAGGSQRTVLYGAANETTYYWDKQTGIMVQAVSELFTCTMHTETKATNLWQPQILGLEASVFYVLAASVAVVVVGIAIVVFLAKRQKKMDLERCTTK